MITTLYIDKEKDMPSPGKVDQSIKELANWRKIRAMKDLPCGALDNAIGHLQKLHTLSCIVAMAELNQQSETTAAERVPRSTLLADSTLER